MRNITYFSLVIVSAVFLSACTAKVPNGTDFQANEDKTPESEQSLSTTMRDLLGMDKNQKCTVSSSSVDDKNVKTDTTGTIYISGKKIAQEVEVTSTDQNFPRISMRMISDGTYMYTWNTETKSQGMKMKINETEEDKLENNDNEKSNGGISMDDKLNVKCSNWIVDNSKFNIPSDVQFTDLSEMMKNIPTMPAGIPDGE
ncbi:MAG TPA: hypothetical protein VLH94_03250 [Spirochaetia bacterium]|nr:hypothetical protein [Spirochaetia bacterium]